MSRVGDVGATGNDITTSSTGAASALGQVDLDQFLNLMIAELQNQDPLNPTDNSEFLAQITQLREIGASDQLSSTLGQVLEGQNLTTASGLIGKQITALSDDLENVDGVVDRVSVEVGDDGERSIRVHVGSADVNLRNVREVTEETATSTTV